MEVARGSAAAAHAVSAGKKIFVGTNVAIAVALVIGVVGVSQVIAYKTGLRWDMTSSGINSLSDATEKLIRNLDTNVRLTSLYFETDLEDEDQGRYRRVVNDLLSLYASTNRAKVTAEQINPLSDHEKHKDLLNRLRNLSAFAVGLAAYQERIDRFRDEIEPQVTALIQQELDAIAASAGGIGGGSGQELLAPVEDFLRRWVTMLQTTSERVTALMNPASPQVAACTTEIRSLYQDLRESLGNIRNYGAGKAATPGLMPEQTAFLSEAGRRYAPLLSLLDEEIAKLQELKPLKLDDLMQKLTLSGNPIVVETPEDAQVVEFAAVWPPIHPQAGRNARFKDRAFKGEEEVTAAILRATHQEQTAVVFVRYGGPPLFLGGFLPGQPEAPYTRVKDQLENANFVVEEWDLKTQNAPPSLDPAPTRTIYVVLRPTPPERGPMGQPGQDPPFTDAHKQALLDAMGENARALFVAGWMPGPFGLIPGTYEYNDYLTESWGIRVDTEALLLKAVSMKPGQYQVATRDWFVMDQVEATDHIIVDNPNARLVGLPWCAPLKLSDPLPEDVGVKLLVRQPMRDGTWGVRNVQTYQQQLEERGYLTLAEGDREGPFDLAVAASRGEAKIVVVSARDFAQDNLAFAPQMSFTSQGITLRIRYPGNLALLINSLHWLNDNTQYMNIGQPIDLAVLEVDKPSTVRAVQVLAMFVWPALALACGGIVWWVRRR